MDYIDKKIIPIKKEQEIQGIEMSVKNGYIINGTVETFVRTELFEQQLAVYLPESFVDMPELIMNLKYPSTSRPKIIKTNLECNVNFLFKYFKCGCSKLSNRNHIYSRRSISSRI